MAGVAMLFCPSAGAEPTPDDYVNVRTPTPPMRCEVSSADGAGQEPTVVCQTAGFPQAPVEPVPYPGRTGDPRVVHQDQAIIGASGRFDWRNANLGLPPPNQPDVTLVNGQTYDFHGWRIVPTADGTRFTNDVTGHGMFIDRQYSVEPF
jgi:hypothetical protein